MRTRSPRKFAALPEAKFEALVERRAEASVATFKRLSVTEPDETHGVASTWAIRAETDSFLPPRIGGLRQPLALDRLVGACLS